MPSGKFSRPTQPPGKSYFKDEVVIRNSDSGKGKLKDLFFEVPFHTIHFDFSLKVMGIKGRRVHMIEELSDTVISFQRGSFCDFGFEFAVWVFDECFK